MRPLVKFLIDIWPANKKVCPPLYCNIILPNGQNTYMTAWQNHTQNCPSMLSGRDKQLFSFGQFLCHFRPLDDSSNFVIYAEVVGAATFFRMTYFRWTFFRTAYFQWTYFRQEHKKHIFSDKHKKNIISDSQNG